MTYQDVPTVGTDSTNNPEPEPVCDMGEHFKITLVEVSMGLTVERWESVGEWIGDQVTYIHIPGGRLVTFGHAVNVSTLVGIF